MPNRPRAPAAQAPPQGVSPSPTWDDLTTRLRAATRPGLYDATERVMNTESGHGRTIGWGPHVPGQTDRAYGPMQIMPGTAGDRHANVADRFDWRQNIDGGARYFAYLVDRYHGDLARASAAYNGGAGHVDKTAGNGVPSRNSGYVESVVPGWTPGTTQRFIAPGYPGGPPLPGPDQSAVVKPPAAPASPPPPPASWASCVASVRCRARGRILCTATAY